jgi:hypothetical protein
MCRRCHSLCVAGHLFKVRDPATGQPLTFAQAKAEMAIMMGAGARLVASVGFLLRSLRTCSKDTVPKCNILTVMSGAQLCRPGHCTLQKMYRTH